MPLPRPKYPKPPACQSCTLEHRGHGFVPADGPPTSPILFVGEAPGYDEALAGFPFAGAAGSMHERLLTRNRMTRRSYRHHNVINCAPPNLALEGMPYQHAAIQHCRYLDDTLAENHPVVVPLGGVALRRILHLEGKGIRVNDFHGTISRDPTNRFWVVPTFHPSHLQRGATNLFGTVSFDLQVAKDVSEGGVTDEPADLIIDPPLGWFKRWAEDYLAAVRADPEGVWLNVDIETPEKTGKDEADLLTLDPDRLADRAARDRSYHIHRINLACHPDQGITVPFVEPYVQLVRTVLSSTGTKVGWFLDYDWPRLLAAECELNGVVYDLPWAAHLLQSDLPLGLGFWYPFYGRGTPWKHLAQSDPLTYAAHDAYRPLRIAFGLARDLEQAGMWGVYLRHVHELRQRVLQPAHDVGVKIDRGRLEVFKGELAEKSQRLLGEIQRRIPVDLLPLTPKGGLTRRPIEGQLHTRARTETLRGMPKKDLPDPIKQELFARAQIVERLILQTIQVCQTCGKQEVHRKHRCEDKQLVPALELTPATVTRYFWQEPFNPDSPDQVLGYIKAKGHRPGRAKQTGHESSDRETLQRLSKSTKDPFYQTLLDYRAVAKVRSTYVLGTEKLLDKDDRVHPVPTFRPSTQRLSYVNPNITNVITDRGGKESLAAGFRQCVVASPSTRLLEVDYCVAPETRVLRSDLVWVRADAVALGDELIGFDERVGKGTGRSNKFRAASVKATEVIQRPRVRITTTHGTITVSADHRFVGRWNPGEYKDIDTERPCHSNRVWIRADRLRVGTLLSFAVSPWEIDTSHEGGYLAGFFDGEGWVSRVNVGYGQNAGPTLERVKVMLQTRGFSFRQSVNSNSSAQVEITTGLQGTLRFLGSIRPPRLLAKARQVWEGRQTWGKKTTIVKVTGLEYLGSGPVVALETTTGTYISEGFFSHNCGIEQVVMGWCMSDGKYIRIAKLGTHAMVAAAMLKQPIQLSRPDHEILSAVKVIKKQYPIIYDRAKRCVHGGAYGLTTHGMVRNFPETFPQVKDAEAIQEVYFSLAPGVPNFQAAVRTYAYDHGYLGGWGGPPFGHPFGYRHWFWSVIRFRPITESARVFRVKRKLPWTEINGKLFAVELGEDAKRVVAFLPQSIAAGILKESMLVLFSDPDREEYLGDAYFGRTPLRAPIHDSLLLEVPVRAWDRVLETVVGVMKRPIPEMPCDVSWGMGEALTIGVEAKAGQDWAAMEVVEEARGVSGERVYFPAEEMEEDDDQDLGTVA